MLQKPSLKFVTSLSFKATIVILIGLSKISQSSAIVDAKVPEQSAKPTVVIVHGAWGGAHQWKPAAAALQEACGGLVHRVTLTGQGERVHLASPENNLETHIQDVVNVIKFEQLDAVILIGHSYGGAVISGVANEIPEKISQLIYLDSNLLEHDESYLTHMPENAEKYTRRANEDGDGWLIPVDWEEAKASGDVPHQLATLKSAITLDNPKRLEIPSTYWLFADGKAAEKDERYLFLERAKALQWQTRVLSWHHNPQKDRPEELAKELSESMVSQARERN